MKKRLYLLCLIHSIVLFCTGQSVPGLFNYQIAVRNAEGLPISNCLMSFQVSIADNLNGSNPIFIETYNQNTNNNGIASFQIGSGTRVGSSVSLSKVPFLQNKFFISIEVDTNNGNNFKTISTTQLISVPYAMTSDSANFALNARQLDRNGANLDQVLKWDGQKWAPKNDSLGIGSSTFTAGVGITLNNGMISNSGDTDANNDITDVTVAGGDIQGKFSNLTVKGIQGKQISQTTPTLDQILQYKGTSMGWVPTTLSSIGGSGWLLTGNSDIDTKVNFIGTKDDKDLIFKRNSIHYGSFGSSSISLGYESLINNTSQFITAIGYRSLASNTKGLNNNAIGSGSLSSNTFGSNNIAIGTGSLNSNTIGYDNIAIGFLANHEDTSSTNNIAIGNESMNKMHGVNNIGIGHFALSGDGNFIYKESLLSETKAYSNIAIGAYALTYNEGVSNCAIGFEALYNNTVGQANCAVGESALSNNDIGGRNTALGYNANTSSSFLNNSTAIGYNAMSTNSNMIRIGDTNVKTIGGEVGWSTLSDVRFKENIKSNIPGLDFIRILNPVSYNIDKNKLVHYITSQMPDSVAQRYYPSEEQINYDKQKIKSGFIAQDVELAAKKIGYDFDGVTTPQNATDTYSIAYSQFVPSIVKAIQEQQVLIELQNRTIEELNVKIADLDQLKVKLVLMESELAKIKEILLKNEK